MTARPVNVIVTDLNSTRTMQIDAHRQLDDVRRQIRELERHELNLVAAIDARLRRFDHLLDEYLAASTSMIGAR